MDKIIASIDSKLNTKIDSQAVQIFDLNKRCDRAETLNTDLAKQVAELKDANRNLASKIELQSQAIDDLEQYSKGSDLLIHGIPHQTSTQSEIEKTWTNVLQILLLPILA